MEDEIVECKELWQYCYYKTSAKILINLSLAFLTVDRFIHTVLPMRYAFAVEEKKIFKKLILPSWIMAVLFGLTVLKDINITVKINFGVTIFTVVTVIFSYTVIIIAVQRSRNLVRGLGSALRGENQGRKSRKQLVPGLLIFFLVLLLFSVRKISR